MDLYGWIQLALFLGLLLLVTRPMGVYLYRVLDPQGKTFLDPVLKPVERLLYRVMRVDPTTEQDWKRTPFPSSCSAWSDRLHLCAAAPAAPAAAQPATSRPRERAPRLQHGGELHHEHELAKLRGRVDDVVPLPDGRLAFHNFGIRRRRHRRGRGARAGIARHSAKTVGNFLVDLVRTTLYLLLPICLLYAVFLVSQGMIQNSSRMKAPGSSSR